MSKLTVRLTDSRARAIAPPVKGYEIHWCNDSPGFGVQIYASGTRSWVLERRVNGKNTRRVLGACIGRGAISGDAARKLMLDVNAELEHGIDRTLEQRKDRELQKQETKSDGLTLEVALADYVEKKRRGKDGLPLKARTKADYLGMVKAGRISKKGQVFQNGDLYTLAKTPIAKITADDMRSVFAETSTRGERVAKYAMQVLRAVLNWHGVQVPDNPLGKDIAGRDRIVLRQTGNEPNPIPVEHLGAWWRAACNTGRNGVGGGVVAGDYYRFRLLTGTRSVEVLGDAFENEPLRVRDVDQVASKITLMDTKNRKDFKLLLSRQALAICVENMKDKAPGDQLFSVQDGRKTLTAINAAAGVNITGHDLRDTFTSIADELVSGYTVKKMVNHIDANDITGSRYVGKGESQLRAAWQAVADFIEGKAKLSEHEGVNDWNAQDWHELDLAIDALGCPATDAKANRPAVETALNRLSNGQRTELDMDFAQALARSILKASNESDTTPAKRADAMLRATGLVGQSPRAMQAKFLEYARAVNGLDGFTHVEIIRTARERGILKPFYTDEAATRALKRALK